jgi:hypothetical protein
VHIISCLFSGCLCEMHGRFIHEIISIWLVLCCLWLLWSILKHLHYRGCKICYKFNWKYRKKIIIKSSVCSQIWSTMPWLAAVKHAIFHNLIAITPYVCI